MDEGGIGCQADFDDMEGLDASATIGSSDQNIRFTLNQEDQTPLYSEGDDPYAPNSNNFNMIL